MKRLSGVSARSPRPAPLRIDDIVEPEWVEWYHLTPTERWAASERMWPTYLDFGGTLDPEPDSQSPFGDAVAPGSRAPDGRAGLRLVRRSGV